MSAALHVPNRKDYLRPSKTLQDLKEKLGSVFIDAQLIECPQNAFELSRLQKRIEELDKQKYRRLADANREQRILYNSLSTKHVSDSSVSSLTDPVIFEIADNKLAPPGFRFHSNGNPKLQFLSTTDTSKCISDIAVSKKQSGSVLQNTSSVPPVIKLTVDSPSVNECNGASKACSNVSSPRLPPPVSKLDDKPLTTKISRNMLDYEREIQNLESIIKDLKQDILSKRSNSSVTANAPNVKHNYLRAHSRIDDDEKRKIPHYFDADFNDSTKGGLKKKLIPKRFHHAKCLACQMKLKHGHEETNKRRSSDNDVKARWNLAPRGRYVTSPRIHLSKRAASAPSLKRYGTNVPSEEVLRTYVISSPGFGSAPDNRDTLRPPTNKSLLVIRSCQNSSMRRFSSPADRESQRLAFRSRAEYESKDVSLRVKDFLLKLNEDKDRQKLLECQKKYQFLEIIPQPACS